MHLYIEVYKSIAFVGYQKKRKKEHDLINNKRPFDS